MISEDAYMVGMAYAGAVKQRVQSYEDEIAALKYQIEALTTAIAIETANGHALKRVLESWQKRYPDAPFMYDKKFTYRDGSPKTVGRVLFEQHFDEKLIELGVSNPLEYRND